VVVSRTLETNRASIFPSVPEALAYAAQFQEDVFVCGGEAVYEECIPQADIMYLSFIKGKHQGKVYFPEFDEGAWRLEKQEEHNAFTFII
jgi:dihydrofolate reductase